MSRGANNRSRRGAAASRRGKGKGGGGAKSAPSSPADEGAENDGPRARAAPRRAICADIARLRSSVEELEVEVECRADEMRLEAASMAQSLRFAFRGQMAKLPSRIKGMTLATFAERYSGSVASVMAEEAERLEDDLSHWVSQTPALTARRRARPGRAAAFGVAAAAADSGSESGSDAATALRRRPTRRSAAATARRATATLRRAHRNSALQADAVLPAAAAAGNRRLTRSMRRSMMIDSGTAAAIARSADDDGARVPRARLESAASGGVVDINSPSAGDLLGKADLGQLKAMQQRMQQLISRLEG